MTKITETPPNTATPLLPYSENDAVHLEAPSSQPVDEISHSPFAEMFPGGATKEELRHFINNCLYSIIRECKRAQESAKRAAKRFLCDVTGKRYHE